MTFILDSTCSLFTFPTSNIPIAKHLKCKVILCKILNVPHLFSLQIK